MKEKKKDLSTREALDSVRKAEKKAQRIVHNAREKTAASIIQKAHGEAGDIKDKILTDARRKAQKEKEKIIQKAESDVSKILRETKQELAALKKTAEKSMPGTVDGANKKILELFNKDIR